MAYLGRPLSVSSEVIDDLTVEIRSIKMAELNWFGYQKLRNANRFD
jgi:hypothetical protein